jgi:hypothetical protein
MNGVKCNVQCYWSAVDRACIIPLGRLSFLIGKNSFGKAEVRDAINVNNGIFSATFTTNGTAVPGANSQATVNFELA